MAFKSAWILVAMALAVSTMGAGPGPPTKELKSLAFAKRHQEARALFERVCPCERPLGPEWLEAMSWVGRAGAIGEDWNLAAEYSRRTLDECEWLLESRALDEDAQAPFPIALGAAIETMGKFHVAKGDRGRAVAYLRDQLEKYGGTSIETRLNKNLLVLDLAGRPMPVLDTGEWLGEARFAAEDLSGKVTLFFFWAHWCEDCEAQKPAVAGLARRYADHGFRVVAPTRLYGYIQRGRDAAPTAEREYIRRQHVTKDEFLREVPVPLSTKNFVSFGVSSTPTLVLVDRSGTVRLYHPGEMDPADLARRIETLLASSGPTGGL